jgi:hypothetical protein
MLINDSPDRNLIQLQDFRDNQKNDKYSNPITTRTPIEFCANQKLNRKECFNNILNWSHNKKKGIIIMICDDKYAIETESFH